MSYQGYAHQTKKELSPQSLDLLKDLQRYMQDFKSKNIDYAIRKFTGIIEKPHPALPKYGSYLKIYVYNMLTHLKVCLKHNQGSPELIYNCFITAKNRRDYFSDKQRDALKDAIAEAEHHHPWLRSKHPPSRTPPRSPPPPSPVTPPPSPPPPSPPPPRHSTSSPPSSIPKITTQPIYSTSFPSHSSSSLSSYDYVVANDEERERNNKRKMKVEENEANKAIKLETPSSEYSISGTVLSQAAESLKQAKAVAQTAKDMTAECNSKIKSLTTRVDEEDKRVRRVFQKIKAHQSSVQNLLEHIESKFYEMEKSIRHLEEKKQRYGKIFKKR